MNNEELKAFAQEAEKSTKTDQDLSDFSQMLTTFCSAGLIKVMA